MRPVITCTRRYQFCAGHRVHGHENKCAQIHGHNYVAMITARADDDGLDHIGRVIDFSVLKEKIGGWIDRNWDHKFIAWEEDPVIAALDPDKCEHWPVYYLPDNPTAENMAAHLLLEVGPRELLNTRVTLTAVRVWETENCYADATL